MKVTRIVNFQATDILETPEVDIEAIEKSATIMAEEIKRHLGFDDVVVTVNKFFPHDHGEVIQPRCSTCIHQDLLSGEFPCNECETRKNDAPTMYIARGE